MFDEDEIKAHLESANRDYVTDVRIREFDKAILLYIPRERVASKVTKGFTSLRQITNLQNHLREFYSTDVDVIFVRPESHYELESSFYKLLNRMFNDRIKSFYISFADPEVIDSWIEVPELDEVLKAQILKKFSELTSTADLNLGDIQWVGNKIDLPSILALLRSIKSLQPVTLGVLLETLQESYGSVDEKWLTKTVDSLRRKGLLNWQKPGSYTLTSESLAYVPAGTRRSSSDIDRALALGRRKW